MPKEGKSEQLPHDVTVQVWGKALSAGEDAAWLNSLKHSSKGFSLRACQVSNRLARPRRVFVPSSLREPPLILRTTTSGRIERSARLLSALNPSISTNWNNSSSCRSSRLARAQHACLRAFAYSRPKLCV